MIDMLFRNQFIVRIITRRLTPGVGPIHVVSIVSSSYCHRIAVIDLSSDRHESSFIFKWMPLDVVRPWNDEATGIRGGTSVREHRWHAANGWRMLKLCPGAQIAGAGGLRRVTSQLQCGIPKSGQVLTAVAPIANVFTAAPVHVFIVLDSHQILTCIRDYVGTTVLHTRSKILVFWNVTVFGHVDF